MASTTINRGNVATTIVMTATITPAATGATTSAEQSFTIPGLQVGDQVSALQYQGAWTVLVDIVNLRVSAANTLGVSFQNSTGGSLTAPSGTYLLEVNRPELASLPTSAY
jgi:hypothetical protein